MNVISTSLAIACLYCRIEYDSRSLHLLRCINLRGAHTTRHNLVYKIKIYSITYVGSSGGYNHGRIVYTLLLCTAQTSSLKAKMVASFLLKWASSTRLPHRQPRLLILRWLALALDLVRKPSGASTPIALPISLFNGNLRLRQQQLGLSFSPHLCHLGF